MRLNSLSILVGNGLIQCSIPLDGSLHSHLGACRSGPNHYDTLDQCLKSVHLQWLCNEIQSLAHSAVGMEWDWCNRTIEVAFCSFLNSIERERKVTFERITINIYEKVNPFIKNGKRIKDSFLFLSISLFINDDIFVIFV